MIDIRMNNEDCRLKSRSYLLLQVTSTVFQRA